MIEIWADEACTVRPDSLAINDGDTIYVQVNRDFGPGQNVHFIGTEEDLGQKSSYISCYVTENHFYSGISLNDDSIIIENNNLINAGSVYRYNHKGSVRHLISFSLGPVISDNPTIVPVSMCSVPMYFDTAEHVWMYAVACLNSNEEFVFLEAVNNALKANVTTQKNDNIPTFAFEPSPLPPIGSPSEDVQFAFSAAFVRQYGKHAPYSHRLVNIEEDVPGHYTYAVQLLVNNTAINAESLIVANDESPLGISEYNV